MKKALFSAFLMITFSLMSTAAFAAFVDVVYGDGSYQFAQESWQHTFDGSITGPLTATITIKADDVDAAGGGHPAEDDMVSIRIGGVLHNLGLLNNWGGFDNGRTLGPNDERLNISETTFDISQYVIPGVSDIFDFEISIFNGTTSHAMEFMSSTLTVSAATPIPGAALLLGSGLVGLVGLRRRFQS